MLFQFEKAHIFKLTASPFSVFGITPNRLGQD